MFEIEDIIEILKTKYPDLKRSELELIIRSQFKFIWENIQSSEFKIINIKNLGKFIPNSKRVEIWRERLKNESYTEYYKRNRNRGKEKENKTDNNKEDV